MRKLEDIKKDRNDALFNIMTFYAPVFWAIPEISNAFTLYLIYRMKCDLDHIVEIGRTELAHLLDCKERDIVLYDSALSSMGLLKIINGANGNPDIQEKKQIIIDTHRVGIDLFQKIIKSLKEDKEIRKHKIKIDEEFIALKRTQFSDFFVIHTKYGFTDLYNIGKLIEIRKLSPDIKSFNLKHFTRAMALDYDSAEDYINRSNGGMDAWRELSKSACAKSHKYEGKLDSDAISQNRNNFVSQSRDFNMSVISGVDWNAARIFGYFVFLYEDYYHQSPKYSDHFFDSSVVNEKVYEYIQCMRLYKLFVSPAVSSDDNKEFLQGPFIKEQYLGKYMQFIMSSMANSGLIASLDKIIDYKNIKLFNNFMEQTSRE